MLAFTDAYHAMISCPNNIYTVIYILEYLINVLVVAVEDPPLELADMCVVKKDFEECLSHLKCYFNLVTLLL